MPVLVVGISHRSASLGILESVSVSESHLNETLERLGRLAGVDEVVLLATCNRLEVYASAEKFHLGYEPIREFLAERADLPLADLAESLYSLFAEDAVRHLFAVVSGLNSAVLGEHEIQGQVKSAWQTAAALGSTGKALNGLFSHALCVGRRIRSETELGKDLASVPHAAVSMAAEELSGLAQKRIVVLGSGQIGETLLRLLPSPPTADVVLASRNWDRARELASAAGVRPLHLEELLDEMVKADVLFTSTGSTSPVIEHPDLLEVMSDRDARPLLVVDVAMPRDVEPSSRQVEGLTLWDMDDIRRFADCADDCTGELLRAESILEAEVQKYREREAVQPLTPLIDKFRRRICDISQSEFERFGPRLESLDDAQREAVEALVHGIVNKVLHEPTARLREAAPNNGGERLADALRELFDV